MKSTSKLIVLLWVSILATQLLNAQEIEYVTVPVSFVRLPYHKLPDNVKTYDAEIKGESKYGNNFAAPEYVKSLITLNGYEWNISKPDLMISLKFTSGIVINELDYDHPKRPKVKATDVSSIRSLRDIGNKLAEAEYYTSHLYKVKCELPALELTIITADGKQLLKRKVGYKKKKLQFGSTALNSNDYYATKDLLDAAWNQEKGEILKKMENDLYLNALSKAVKVLTEYCLQQSQVDVKIAAIPYSKKNGEHNYDDFNKAKDLSIAGLKLIANDKIAGGNKLIQPKYEEVRTKVKAATAIWEKMLQESNPEDKKARVDATVTRELYYNLAKSYLWIDDYAKAREYYQLRTKEAGRSTIAELGQGLNEFGKLLDDQEKRYIQNSWRDIYVNEGEVRESVTKTESREKRKSVAEASLDGEEAEEEFKVDTTKFSTVYFYMPKAPGGLNKNSYGIFMNDVLIGELKGGERVEYKIYSTGELKLLSKKMAKGDGEGEVDRKKGLGLLGSKEESIDINVRTGEKYYIKVAWSNGLFKQEQEIDGEKSYKSNSNPATVLKEDIEDPIPNLNIAIQNEK